MSSPTITVERIPQSHIPKWLPEGSLLKPHPPRQPLLHTQAAENSHVVPNHAGLSDQTLPLKKLTASRPPGSHQHEGPVLTRRLHPTLFMHPPTSLTHSRDFC